MRFDRHKLEALLGRIQHNMALPRASATTAGAAPAGSDGSHSALELDEPGLDSLSPPAHAAGGANELDLDEPPESGRSRVRSAEFGHDDEADGHPPLTPPPESGEEPAPKVSIPRDPGPTMAQLGQTITLDEPSGDVLELAEPPPPPSRRGVDQLEMSPPQMGYSEELPLPENAREELDRVRLGQSTEVGPTVHARPVLSTNVVDFVSAVRSYQPETFLDLLDTSLRL